MKSLGEFTPGKTVSLRFNTHKADGTPITLAGTPAISVYKSGSTTESTAGVTLTVDYDSRTGLHNVAIDTSADGTFYSAGSDFDVTITTGTVDAISVVGTVVGTFSLSNRAGLRPTTADRTLDVTSTGEAGIDWANIGAPTTTQNLSGTTIGTLTALAANAITATVIATGAITAAKFAAGAIDAAAIAADAITDAKVASDVTIASVTGAVGSVTGNVGGSVVGSIGSLAAQAKLDVNAEVDTALADVNLDHLVGTATGIPAIVAGTYIDQMMDDGTAVYDRTTDSLQAIRDATLSANVVSIGANVITATSIAADAITAAKIANGAIDAATFASGAIDAAAIADAAIDAAAIASGAITAAKFGAGAIDAAALATDGVNEIRDAVWAKTMTELASVPGVTADVLSALEWIFLLGRNKINQTATTQAVRNDADSATIGTATVSDDGTTAVRGEFA